MARQQATWSSGDFVGCLGAAWGKHKALEMLEQAGFRDVRVEQWEHDFLNCHYVAEKRGDWLVTARSESQ